MGKIRTSWLLVLSTHWQIAVKHLSYISRSKFIWYLCLYLSTMQDLFFSTASSLEERSGKWERERERNLGDPCFHFHTLSTSHCLSATPGCQKVDTSSFKAAFLRLSNFKTCRPIPSIPRVLRVGKFEKHGFKQAVGVGERCYFMF